MRVAPPLLDGRILHAGHVLHAGRVLLDGRVLLLLGDLHGFASRAALVGISDGQ